MSTLNARPRTLPLWASALLPLAALGLMLSLFAFGDPLAAFKANLPPVESLTVERVRVTTDGFELTVVNGGPQSVTVAQVTVDEVHRAAKAYLVKSRRTVGYYVPKQG